MASFQNAVRRLSSSFSTGLKLLINRGHFKAVMGRFDLTPLLFKNRPIFKMLSQASKSKLFLWCLSSERPFGAVTVKFSLNAIRTQKMENLQNGVRRLEIIVFSWSYRAYLQRDIFQHLQ